MRKFVLGITLLGWLTGVVGGLGALARYTATPGILRAAPNDWPASTRVARVSGRPTLLLFAHPRCPCTRATLTEWGRLIAQCGEAVTPVVLFIQPQDMDTNWTHTDLWDYARSLPDLVMEDRNGVEARRFHADTSGLVLLYSANGRLLFRGGITPGRGHEGDSPGKDTITAILRGDTPRQNHSTVFGCSLFSPLPNATLPDSAGKP